MKKITIPEHGQLHLWPRKSSSPESTGNIAYLEEKLYSRLWKHEKNLKRNGKSVFTWYSDHAKANQWVGVVQVPGLQVEILPKVDNGVPAESAGSADKWNESRRSLLYMLSVAGDIPIRSREMSRLATRKAPLNETLSAIFANNLKEELLRGCERHYVRYEQNMRVFKGRLLINKQVLRNTAHRERFYCQFEQFSEDTVMNRIFKAACRLLVDVTRLPGTQDALRHCLLLMDDVRDVEVLNSHFDRVSFNRQNQRYENLFHFCRLILGNRAPTISSGKERSFSLLFDMNVVFERFIAMFMHEKIMPSMPDYRLYPQARRNRRPLFLNDNERGELLLEPDILIRHNEEQKNLIIDTKWKVGKVSSGDLYQLYAYTQRYDCGQSVLLYPAVPGAKERNLHVLNELNQKCGQKVGVRFVNINRDLYSKNEREKLASELESLVREGFGSIAEGNA